VLFKEVDLIDFPVNEEVRLEPNAWRPDTRFARRFRLTSHRLLWQEVNDGKDEWLSLRLDGVAEVQDGGGGWVRAPRVRVVLKSGDFVLIKSRGEEGGLAEKLLQSMQEALTAQGWTKGSYEAPTIGGLQRVIDSHTTRQRAMREELGSALADLDSLRKKATAASVAMRQLAAQADKSSDPATADVRSLLQDFGLVGPEGKSVAVGADVEADVVRVCEAALEKRGGLGLLPVHDVYCLVNRARGTALASPSEVMAALRHAAGRQGKLRLRTLGSTGAWAVSLARTQDEETDGMLLKMIEEDGPLSPEGVASKLGLTTAEVSYLLKDAEERAVLVRDEAYSGVAYYRNFFKDY